MSRVHLLKIILEKFFYWYGIPLRISGIVEEISYEHAKEKQMPYMNDTYLFVKKGFIQHHPLSNMQSFPLSSKRMLINNRSYEINRFSENPHYLYYTNGSMVLNSLDTLKENEVVLDFQSAVLLGFPYQRIFFDENKTYEEKIWEYLVYIEQVDKFKVFVYRHIPFLRIQMPVHFFKKILL